MKQKTEKWGPPFGQDVEGSSKKRMASELDMTVLIEEFGGPAVQLFLCGFR